MIDTSQKRSINSVAVIGVGAMGNPMARHIHENGFDLMVSDPNPDALAALEDLECKTTTKVADCADCDVALILVATADQLRDVVLGPSGLAGRLEADAPLKYIVVMSTVSSEVMREIANGLQESGVFLLDAPISGGVVGAKRGTLTFLVGGAEEHLDALTPLLKSMGSSIFLCGPLGAGQTTKVVNNIIAISNLMVSAEAYRIAIDHGLDLKAMIPALEAGSGRNFLSATPDEPFNFYGNWTESKKSFNDSMRISLKDLELAGTLNTSGLDMPALSAITEILRNADDETFANFKALADSKSS